jgi:protein-tyrosine phosphatase
LDVGDIRDLLLMSGDEPRQGFKRAIRKIVPDSLLRERGIFLRLGPKAGPIYARLRLLDSLGVHSQSTGVVKPTARSFLFICFGNIMRSPMAEVMLRKSAADANLLTIRAHSAGLHAVPGTEAHPTALAASTEIGLPLTQHRAQLLTAGLVAQADVIFVMDFQNKAEMLALYPDASDKILMLSAYAEGPKRYREIPDPYFGDLDTTRDCYILLQVCIRNLTKELVEISTIPVPAPASS